MRIEKGATRLVLVLPCFGIVVKVARVYLVCAFQEIWYCFNLPRGRRLEWVMMELFEFGVDVESSIKFWLFKGIVSNWREYWFYRRTKNLFCQPTYFSLLGLVNVQRYGSSCDLDDTDLWCQLYELTDGKVFQDSHCFVEPKNFCFEKEALTIADYGSLEAQWVIDRFGDKIIREFDSNFKWTERRDVLFPQKE